MQNIDIPMIVDSMYVGTGAGESEVTRISVSQLTDTEKINVEGAVAKEQALTIMLNNQELITLLCTPMDVNYLAIGFLFSEGLIKDGATLKKITVDNKRGIVRVETYNNAEPSSDFLFKRIITSGCGRGASFYNVADAQQQKKIESQLKVSTHDVLTLVHEFQRCSRVYEVTHGVHSAALCDSKNIIVFNEDVGRHNAIDKIFGECLLKDISTEERIVITSGRISSEILLKVSHRNIPILISVSAPTDLGVKLADDLGITLVGLVRGKKMTAYTNDWRLESGGE